MKQDLLKTLLMMLIAFPTGSTYAATFTADDGNTYTWTANEDGTNTATITGASTINSKDLVIPAEVTEDNTTLSYTVTQIGNGAFNANNNIASVTFPSTLTDIQTHAFLECKSLKSIAIPSNVTYIGVAAFRGCIGVKTITIASSPNLQIDYAAFCTDDINSQTGNMINKGALKNVFFTTSTPPTLVKSELSFVEGTAPYFPSTAKIFVPDATDGTATTSTQYKYKQNLNAYSSLIFKYFDKTLAGPYNDGNLDQYYGTLALPYAVEIPSDDFPLLATGTVSSIKKNKGLSEASVVPISTGYIPASTGVVLQSPAIVTPVNIVRFLETTAAVDAISGNKLQPCLSEGGMTNDKTSYLTLGRDKELLAQGQTVIGFYIYTGSTIAGNTAYMNYGDAGAKKVVLSFGDDTPTSINTTTEGISQSQQNMIFDLQGRRVMSPKKGNCYVINGKKVIY